MGFIPEELTRRRTGAGLSRTELAKKAGLSHVTIYEAERGIRNPSLATVTKIATALAVDLWIFFDDSLQKSVSKSAEAV